MKKFISLEALNASLVACTKCPRLVQWRQQVATVKRRRYQDWEYWGKPVPGFGDPNAMLLIVGLAPGAHGANRTGRMFTGDRSGEWLYRALFEYGFASQPESISRDDGLTLSNCYITAAVRCAPPNNLPTREERQNCFEYLRAEFSLLPNVRVLLALGGIAWETSLRLLRSFDVPIPRPKPRFRHGATVQLGTYYLIGSYHPSQQNTLTGRLTDAMWRSIFAHVRATIDYLRFQQEQSE